MKARRRMSVPRQVIRGQCSPDACGLPLPHALLLESAKSGRPLAAVTAGTPSHTLDEPPPKAETPRQRRCVR